MGAAEAGGGEGAAPGRQLLSLGSKRAGGRGVAAAAAAAAGKGLRAWALVQTKPKATAYGKALRALARPGAFGHG